MIIKKKRGRRFLNRLYRKKKFNTKIIISEDEDTFCSLVSAANDGKYDLTLIMMMPFKNRKIWR